MFYLMFLIYFLHLVCDVFGFFNVFGILILFLNKLFIFFKCF